MHLTDHTGVGIGLTLVKKVCEELGGTVHLVSKQNAFTKFTCYFNISQTVDDEENDEESSKSSCSSSSSGNNQSADSFEPSEDDSKDAFF